MSASAAVFFPRAIFERSRKCWHVRKFRPLSEESRDLHIGINPFLQLPENLQKILRAKEDRRIALLPSHYARIRAQILRRRELSGCRANDLSASRLQFSLLANDAINFRAISGIEGRVVQDGVAVSELGDNSLLRLAGNSV